MADSSESQEPPSATDVPLLFGRYRVERELGRGGMGRVLLAFDTKLRIHVAVKLVPDQLMADAEAADDLRREVLRGIALSHPAIVRTHTFEQDETGAAIVMEYIDGLTFTEWKTQQPGHCFDCEQLLPWLGPLCEVLDYAHREARIVHRDLKPRNIMISQEGKLKVADFGIAATLTDSHSRLTSHANMSGTPAYMSPQQARGKKPSHLDDVYSLGATIYDLIAGKPPFFRGSGETILMQVVGESAPTMAERREELFISGKAPIPEHWEQTIAACLAKDPAERPQSCGDVLARLLTPTPAPEPVPAPQPLKPKNVVPPEPVKKPMARVAAPRPTVPLPSTPPPRRHSTWPAPAIAVLVIALAVGVWWFVQGRKPASVASPAAVKPAVATLPTEPAAQKPEATPTTAPLVAKAATPQPPKPTPASITPTPATPKPLSEIDKWLAQVEAIYQPKWQSEVVAPYESGLDELKKNTLAALDTQIANASRSAKLNDAIAFRNDRQRVESDQGVPDDDRDNPPVALKTLRTTWRTQSARLETDRRQHAQNVFGQYDQVLATNQGALTQRQRLDEALQLQQRREALKKEWLGPPPAKPTTATKENPFVNSLGMKFVPVPQTNVLFCIHETRKQDFAAYVKDTNGNLNLTPNPRDGVPVGELDDDPITARDWHDAQAFCDWLSKKEGRTYRLPTDREWSFAVGIGEQEDWSDGATPETRNMKLAGVYLWRGKWPPPAGFGNFADSVYQQKFPSDRGIDDYTDGFPTTSPVMSFPSNQLGIYDLAGNMWEWCGDWYDAGKTSHYLRGGAWSERGPNELLASYRKRMHDQSRGAWGNHGFRCVLALAPGVDQSAPARNQATPTSSPTPRATVTPATPTPRPAVATGNRPDAALAKATKDAPFINSLGMKFVPVPGTKVLFCIHETRRQDYAAYDSESPGVDGTWKRVTDYGGFKITDRLDEHPVWWVSWDDAHAFCAWLSQREGQTYRLPTDREWSHAVGVAGKEHPTKDTTPEMLNFKVPNEFPWGGDYPPRTKDSAGNYGDVSFKQQFPEKQFWLKDYRDGFPAIAPVMSFKPNRWGIYDLGGNLQEWCEDWMNAAQKGRVVRGGSFQVMDVRDLCSCSRGSWSQQSRGHYVGFRCVVELPGP